MSEPFTCAICGADHRDPLTVANDRIEELESALAAAEAERDRLAAHMYGYHNCEWPSHGCDYGPDADPVVEEDR
jgi:hypothetical protein